MPVFTCKKSSSTDKILSCWLLVPINFVFGVKILLLQYRLQSYTANQNMMIDLIFLILTPKLTVFG